MGFFDRFAKPPRRIVRDAWNGYHYVFGEGERCIVTFDVTACEPASRTARSNGMRVIGFSPEGEISPSGMPSQRAFARLAAIEDAMIAALETERVACWLVGRQVYRGFRELVFQVEDEPAFERVYANIEKRFGGMDLVRKEGWTFFDEKIAPGERGHNHIGNRDVIEGLKKAGSDLARPHVLEHHFVGPGPALQELAREVAGAGFRELTRDEGSLTLANEAPLTDQDDIDAMTMWLRRTAAEHGVTYDGWGTRVLRPGS